MQHIIKALAKTARGFTAVELLIVIVVLGVLVGIIIPRFGDTGALAQKSSALATLQVLRTQLGLAKVQHEEYYPDLGDGGSDWDILLVESEPFSDPSGAYEPGNGDENDVGPYLRRRPENPFELSDTIADIGQANQGVGFVYNQGTGEIKVVVPNELFDELDLSSQDFEPY